MASQADRNQGVLERARQRLDQAAPGSPDWDAASEAIIELEARNPAPLDAQPRRKLFVVESRAAG